MTLEYFVSNGANFLVYAYRQDDAFETYCKELEAKHGVWVKPVYFYLTDADAIKAAVKTIQKDITH